MARIEGRPVPRSYWTVAVLALLWEAFGCYVYTSQSLLPEAARAGGYTDLPAWQWGVFAVAVWSGLIGAVGLLLRARWAVAFLLISLIAALIQYGWVLLTTGLASEALPVAAAVILFGAALVWFAGHASRRGWLR